MFVAFILLNILLCDEVLSYFVLRVEVIRSLNLDLNQKNLNLYRGEFKDNPANPANPTRVNPIWVKGFALPQLNPANPDSPATLTQQTQPLPDKEFALTWLPDPDLTKPGFPT
jgi:hypothetical protein